MKTQILKSFMLTFIVGMALILMSATESNARVGITMRIKIPFDYTIGNKILPAGKYEVGKLSDGLFRIGSEDGKHAILTQSMCSVESRGNSLVKMVFHRYGDEYFLSQIFLGSTTGAQLHKSKAERKAEKNMRLAKNDAKPEVVEVIALVK
jgi:hypothetical protein